MHGRPLHGAEAGLAKEIALPGAEMRDLYWGYQFLTGAMMLTRAAHLEAGRKVRVLSLSPGTVATDMQKAIKASGVNAVSQLDWSAHVPAEWPARALVWMATSASSQLPSAGAGKWGS